MPTLIYFSPSGNVQHLAKKLAVNLGVSTDEILPLEFTDPGKLTQDDHLVLLFPVHGFNAPRTVKRFVRTLPPNLYNGVSLLAVGCNTGWVNAAVSSDLKIHLRKKGYSVKVDEVLAMPLTFIMNFPDDLNLKLIAESEIKIGEIGRAIMEQNITKRKVGGKSHVLNFLGKGESAAGRMFGLELHANKQCTSCGTCWSNCPEKNITQKKNGKPGFGFSCLMCMRCLYNCPEKAISPYISKFMPVKGGYTISKYLKD